MFRPFAACIAAIALCVDAQAQDPALFGSWEREVTIPASGQFPEFNYMQVYTFTAERFTFTVHYDDLIVGSGQIAATLSGPYTIDDDFDPPRITLSTETISNTPVEDFTGGFPTVLRGVYGIDGTTLTLAADFAATFPESLAGGLMYENIETRGICDFSTEDFLVQLDVLRTATGLLEDANADGIPDGIAIELIRFVACSAASKVPSRTNIGEAAQSAFLLNMSLLESAGVEEGLEAAALLMLSSREMQMQVLAALTDLGFTLPEIASLVTCDDNRCRADARLVEDLFDGEADLDGDGLSNLEEFEASGGVLAAFLEAATDNLAAPIDDDTGCDAGGSNAMTPFRAADFALLAMAGIMLAFLSPARRRKG